MIRPDTLGRHNNMRVSMPGRYLGSPAAVIGLLTTTRRHKLTIVGYTDLRLALIRWLCAICPYPRADSNVSVSLT